MSRIIPNENSWLGFVPNTSAAALSAPVQAALATATTGGSIGAGTYYYVVTATNAAGETTRSNEDSIVVPNTTATNTNTVSWAAVSGATGYKIYRGLSAGNENLLVGTVGSVLTYADTGATSTAANPPTTNSTGGSTSGIATYSAPSAGTELIHAIDLTGFLISITANTTGNTVPTPTLKSRFESSIQGTVAASFSADFYRDDAGDLAWTTLPRGTKGAFVLSRFAGHSTTVPGMPIQGDTVEVWPVNVTSRAASGMTSNTAEMFSLTCSVPSVPTEAAVVAV